MYGSLTLLRAPLRGAHKLLVHQIVSPRERVGSGDETNSGDARLELSLPTICWIKVALEFRSVSKVAAS